MTTALETAGTIPWWKEPTKDQWLAWWAAWLGWTLDAFDFTVFLLIMVAIAKEFGVPLTEVTVVLTITLWMRLVGAVASGWLADRIGRKTPLMISILWYSICNFIAGFAPSFWFLFLFRALLGIGMGAEWPAGAALAMEQWPARSRGLMSGILQGSWALGFLLSSALYGLFYDYLGWRGMLWIGVLPALTVVYVRYFVKEPEVWVENRKRQRVENREVRTPLFSIFKRGVSVNTLTACWWMASAFVVYYSIWALFATHLQKDLKPQSGLGRHADRDRQLRCLPGHGVLGLGGGPHRATMVDDHPGRDSECSSPPCICSRATSRWIVIGFVLQGLFGGAIYGQFPSYLCERFPTEVRATASAFCYHQGAIFGGLVAPILTYIAVTYDVGFGVSMLVGTVVGAVSFVLLAAR